jgi:serine/threonine protein kinase
MYDYVKKLGAGSSGSVFLLKNTTFQNKYAAVKVLKNNVYFQNEIVNHSLLLPHKNIIDLYNVTVGDDDNIFILLEYAQTGDVFTIIKKNKSISEMSAKYLFKQLIDAVDHCHKHNICHRDIKLENLLLNETILKLADFGYSSNIDNIKSNTILGTLHYLSPEIIKQKINPVKSDIWACGVCLYTMIVGKYPFQPKESHELTDYVRNIVKMIYTIPDTVSDDCKDLLEKIFNPDSHARISIAEIIKHPFMTD